MVLVMVYPAEPSVAHVPPVLLAEDDHYNTFFLQRAFLKVRVPNRLIAVCDGQEAIDYLSGAGPYADRARYPLPCLLLTDIRMPRVDGFELLVWLQGQPQFRELPVVVLRVRHTIGAARRRRSARRRPWPQRYLVREPGAAPDLARAQAEEQDRSPWLFPDGMLNGCSHEHDLQRALSLGARAYWVKPADLCDLDAIVRELQKTWLRGPCRLQLKVAG